MNGTGSWQLGNGFYLRSDDDRPLVGINSDNHSWWLYVRGSGDDVELYAQPDIDHSKLYFFEKSDCVEHHTLS